jgi:hypothetical protein
VAAFERPWPVWSTLPLHPSHLVSEQGDRLIREDKIGYGHFTFVHKDLRRTPIKQHIEDRTSNSDHGRRCVHTVRIRLAAQFLNLNSRLSLNDIEECPG